MKSKDSQLALILIVAGVIIMLLPRISEFADHPAEGGKLPGPDSGGGYNATSGFDIPWWMLQQTPDTGYVGIDPPVTPAPEPEPEPTPALVPDDGDGLSLWGVVKEVSPYIVIEEILRKGYNYFKDTSATKKPPSGGTPAPAPVEKPGPAPVGFTVPDFDPVAYVEPVGIAAGAAGITAALSRYIPSGLAARAPSAAGAVIVTPEMLGAPAGTTKRNIGMALDRWRRGAVLISKGHVLQGISIAARDPVQWKSRGGKRRYRYSHGTYDRPMERKKVGPGKVLITPKKSKLHNYHKQSPSGL